MSLIDVVDADIAKLNTDWAAYKASLAPAPGPVLDSVTLYDGAFFGSKGFRVVGISQNGNAYPPPRPVWGGTDPTYTCGIARSPMAQAGDVCGTATWGTSTEYHRVPALMLQNQQWLWIDGYGPSTGLASGFYPVETLRGDWVNLYTGAVLDVTPPGPPPQGQPYMPGLVPASGLFLMRIWGWIWSSMTGGRSSTFYWEGSFKFGLNVFNPAWLGDAQTTKPSYSMAEGWWSNGTWIRATGTDPFDANNNPVVPTVSYLGSNANAKGVGTMWNYSYAPNVAGVESIHSLGGA